MCCAAGDRVPLEPAFELLDARRVGITILEGADLQPAALLDQVRRQGTDAIYVLTKSTELHAPRNARLVELLRSALVPPEHILDLKIDWRDPMALLEQLDRAQRVPPARPRMPTIPPAPEIAPSQTMLAPISPAATHPIGETSAPHVPMPPPSRVVARPRHATQRIDGLLSGTRARVAFGSMAAVGVVLWGIALFGRVASATLEPIVVPVDDASEPARSAAGDRAAKAEPRVEPPSVATPPSIDDVVTPKPRPNVGVHEGVTFSPLQSPLLNFAAATTLCETMGTKTGEAWRMPTLGELHTLGHAKVVDNGAYWAISESEGFGMRALVWNEGKSRAVPVAKRWKGARALCVTDRPVPPSVEPLPALPEFVANAQAKGEVGVVDEIVYAPLRPQKHNFAGAEKMCDDLSDRTKQTWRVPTLSELHTLGRSRVLERGVYWSGTDEEGFGARALLWNEKRLRAAPVGKRWKGGRAVCVLVSVP